MTKQSEKARGLIIGRSIKVLHFLSTPGWKSYASLADYLQVSMKTARRWVRAVEDAGLCIEMTREGIEPALFRLVLMDRRVLDASHNIRVAARTV